MVFLTILGCIPKAIQVFFKNRSLLFELTRREIRDRHVGQILGVWWAVGHPLFLVFVYVFVFGTIFQLRLGNNSNVTWNYIVYMLAGLLPWLTFQETLTKGPGLLLANKNLIKQVVFPVEILPGKVVLGAAFTLFISTTGLVLYLVINQGNFPWTLLLLPLLWIVQILAMIGVVFILAPVGAYFRDIKELVQVFSAVGIYLTPIVYLPEWVPAGLRFLLYANPFSYMVWCYQDACYYGNFQHYWAWPVFFIGAVGTFALGFAVFQRVKMYLGTVL